MQLRLPSYRKIISESIANVGYFGIQSLLFLVLTPRLLSILGNDLYGLWTILLSIVVFAGYVNFGSIAGVIKYTARFSVSDDLSDKFSAVITFNYFFIFFVSVLISTGAWWARSVIATKIETSVTTALLATAIGLVAISFTPNYLAQVSRGVLWGLLYNKLAGGIFLIHDIFLWVGALLIGIYSGNVVQLGLWILLVSISRFIFTTIAAFRKMRPYHLNIRLDKDLNKELLQFALLDWFGIIGVAMFTVGSKILAGVVLGAVAAGVYGIGSGIVIRISALADYLSLTLSPFSSSYQEGKKFGQIKQVFRQASRLVASIIVAIIVCLVIWIDYVLSIWISPQFSLAYSGIFRTFIICYGIYALASPSVRILEGMGWISVRSIIQFFCGIGLVLGMFYFGKLLGIYGAVISNAVLAGALLMNIMLAKKLKMSSFKVIIQDLGFPIVILFLISVINFPSLSILVRIITTSCILLSLLVFAVLTYPVDFIFLSDFVRKVIVRQ